MSVALNLILAASAVIGQIEPASAQARSETDTPPVHECYDGFDYLPAEGTLLGKAGGEGFQGPWSPAGFNARNPDAYRIVAGSLGSSDPSPGKGYVRTEASRAEALPFRFDEFPTNMTYQPIKGIGRRLANPVDVSETTTLYVAALIRPKRAADGVLFGGYVGFYLDGSDDNDLYVGAGADDNAQYRLATRGGTGRVMSQHRAEIDRTDLLVVKAELRPGPDVFTLYVNPDTRAAEPPSGTVKRDLDLGRVDQLVLYSTGAFSLDEFRITDKFSALTDYPSPEELERIRESSMESSRKE